MPDAQKSIGLSNNRTVTFAGFAPSLIPVQEVRVIPWLRSEDIYSAGSGGNDRLILIDTANTAAVTGQLAGYQVPVYDLAAGKINITSVVPVRPPRSMSGASRPLIRSPNNRSCIRPVT